MAICTHTVGSGGPSSDEEWKSRGNWEKRGRSRKRINQKRKRTATKHANLQNQRNEQNPSNTLESIITRCLWALKTESVIVAKCGTIKGVALSSEPSTNSSEHRIKNTL